MEILLVGFGTLLYRASLAKTIGDGAHHREMRPVIVQDYRRLFNLRPDHYKPSAELSRHGIECGAMNIEHAPGAWLNGVAFPVIAEDLERLDQRERYYRRIKVDVLDFGTRQPLGDGFVYAADVNSIWIERSVSRLLPLWRDIVWARAGAYRISSTFGEAFDATTYLADGKTLVVERYRELLEKAGDPIAAVDSLPSQ